MRTGPGNDRRRPSRALRAAAAVGVLAAFAAGCGSSSDEAPDQPAAAPGSSPAQAATPSVTPGASGAAPQVGVRAKAQETRPEASAPPARSAVTAGAKTRAGRPGVEVIDKLKGRPVRRVRTKDGDVVIQVPAIRKNRTPVVAPSDAPKTTAPQSAGTTPSTETGKASAPATKKAEPGSATTTAPPSQAPASGGQIDRGQEVNGDAGVIQ